MYNISDISGFTILIVVFILGIATGSFLNVCIYRIPKGQSILSDIYHCMNCGARIKAVDRSVTLSFMFARGQCSSCGARYRVRNALVELLTGLVFTFLLFKYGLSVEYFAHTYIMTILITVLFIDIDHRIIPDELVVAGLTGGFFLVIYNLFQPFEIFGDRNWWNPLLGAVVGSGFLFLVALAGLIIYKTDDAMGMGDVKIFAPIGLFLGWKMTIVALILSIFVGGIISLILIVFKIKGRKSTIPFGPFIVISTFVTLMWGWDIIRWYLAAII